MYYYLVTLEFCGSYTVAGPPSGSSKQIFSFTIIKLCVRRSVSSIADRREDLHDLKKATSSASFMCPRHHWHHITSKPDSASPASDVPSLDTEGDGTG